MVLNDLGKKITGALKKLGEAPVIDEDSLKELLKEIGNALMQASPTPPFHNAERGIGCALRCWPRSISC